MKILMISDVYFPRINGVSTSIFTFKRELLKLGYEIFLITPDYGQSEIAANDNNNILRIPARKVIFDPEDRIMNIGKILTLTKSLKINFDLVHIQTPFAAHYAGLKLARYFKVPCIASYHTFFEEYLYHYLSFMPKNLMRYLARSFSRSQCNVLDALIVPSQAMLKVLRNYGIKTPIHIIPTGIDANDLVGGNEKNFRYRYNIHSEQLIAIYVGRVAFEKKIEFLLKVIEKVKQVIPQILLLIVGDGPARQPLEKLVLDLKITENVKFVGYLARQGELRDAYKAADVFVFSSDTETQGLVLLEAMSLGVPVLSTAEMGTWDILQAGKGAIIAKHDLDDFSDKLINLLQDEQCRNKLAQEGIIYAREWSASAMAIKMSNLYKLITCNYR